MRHLPVVLFVCLAIAVTFLIVSTSDRLPERVASHFGGRYLADAWMIRDGYRVWMLTFVLLLPGCIVALIAGLPRIWPGLTNIPHREYWMAPERRSGSLAFLALAGCWLGCLLIAFGGGIHLVILEANAAEPARLPRGMFLGTLVSFVVMLFAWIAALYWRFRKSAAGE